MCKLAFVSEKICVFLTFESTHTELKQRSSSVMFTNFLNFHCDVLIVCDNKGR